MTQEEDVRAQVYKGLVEQVPETLQRIVTKAEQAQEVLKSGLKKKLIKQARTTESANAETKLLSNGCLRNLGAAFSELDPVSKILAEDNEMGNTSKAYLLKKLGKILDHDMGEGKTFMSFTTDGPYVDKEFLNKHGAADSLVSQKIAQTLGAASSLANSIHKAYEYPFILDYMQEQCEEIAKQNLSPQDELSQMADDLNQITKKIPESPEARMLEKHLLENIQPTLESISAAAKETIAEVSANGIGADKLAEPIRKLTMNFNQVFKASQVMTKYVDISKDAEKTFLLETIGELSRRNLNQDSPDFPALSAFSLTDPDKYVDLSSEERVGKGALSQNVIYIAQSATLLADLTKNNYHSPASLKKVVEELSGMSCDVSSPKVLLEQLQNSHLQSKIDKSQLEFGKAAKPEKTEAMVTSVKGSAFKVSSTLFVPQQSAPTASNDSEPVKTRGEREESRQGSNKNLSTAAFTTFVLRNRETDEMSSTTFTPVPKGKTKEEPQKLGPSHS